ncbi:MAG: M23 family metallopeptidase [Spirochaetaceae bacterium]|nr:MAG: M23 family metallopeptidase [Spirochaetaceae bacterium]
MRGRYRRITLAALLSALLSSTSLVVHAQYVFPLAAPPEYMAWERFHWDGSDEVDIEAAPELAHGSEELARFERSPVVAVTAGRVRRADNERGGIALILDGDDGYRYYYAHLSRSVIEVGEAPRRVRPGDRLGTIGRSGRWSRYLETHLHFSVTDGDGQFLNGADWFLHHFGLEPLTRTWEEYDPAWPEGPISPAKVVVIRDFETLRARNRDTASVEVALEGSLVSPLTGEVRVMRNTIFGRRVQVTNRHTDQTLVFSGLESFSVRTGDTVERGDPLGWNRGVMNVMYFDRGRLRDPLPVVLVPPEEAHHSGEKKNQPHDTPDRKADDTEERDSGDLRLYISQDDQG